MTTYALTVSTNALGLGVISGATVRVEKRRIAIADTYPPINNLIQIAQATNSSGIATFLLQPDDLTTYHVAKIFDTAGIFIYERFFSMPPSATSLDNTVTGVLFGNSNIQFKDEGNNRGTPSSVRNVDFVGAGVEATFEGDTLRVFVQAGSQGFVAITDITPTNPSDNVGSKIKTDDNNVLQSCISSTPNITVSVLAVTAGQSFKPSVTVNGVAATLSRNALTDVWTGSAAITLTGEAPYTVTATHSEGATDTAIVNMEALPVVTNMQFSGAYPNVGQTEHAQGQTLSLTITSDTQFTELEIVDDVGTATEALSLSFAATTTKTVTVTVADRGSYGTGAPIIVPAKARIKSANGTWGNYFESNDFGGTNGVHILALNNTRPLVAINSIVYPVGQYALKDTESVTVNVSESNVDSLVWSSPNSQLSISSPSTSGNKTVTRASGGYNITDNNLRVVSNRVANATQTILDAIVWIAHDAPTITVTTPAARLRSGVTPQNHTITINSNQRTQATPTLTASIGTFGGTWSTVNNGTTWTRQLSISDSDTKGAATFSGLSITNLAGIEVTTITNGENYTVGGFTARSIVFGAWPNRESDIGTVVVDTSKLVVFNIFHQQNMTYQSGLSDSDLKFTVTNGSGSEAGTKSHIYNRDYPSALTNSGGQPLMTVEETV
ncbi:MAG TPA: hypothetical protein PKC11_08175, partial [Agitococcus sp.]|nr:hypothetical protein [Agitococcus sp.]